MEHTMELDNQVLLSAVERMGRENSRESREAVLDLVVSSARFLAPVEIDPPPEAGEEGQGRLGAGTSIRFHLLPNQEGQPYFPAFTSWEELRRLCGPKNQQTLVLSFDDYAGMILRDGRGAGFVIDPFGVCLSFDRAMVEHLVRRKEEQAGQKA